MESLFYKVILGVIAAVLVTSVASAAVVGTFGDFTVFDSAIDTGVTFFDSGSNPSPFPAPATIDLWNVWPAAGDSLTVGQMQTYLSGQGLPSNTFLALFKKANAGACTLSILIVFIDVSPVASGAGSLSLGGTGVFAFDGNIDLSSYSVSSSIHVAYVLADLAFCDSLSEINLAAAPEPISMALLGTGFAGMILARAKRKKKRS